jgi:hypothetical protein
MTDWLGNIKSWLSLSLRQVTIVAVVGLLLLFLPDNLIQSLGVANLLNIYRPWVGIVTLVASVYIVVGVVFNAGDKIIEKVKGRWRVRQGIKSLESLTPPERQLLCEYIENETQTASVNVASGVVLGLQGKGILYQASIVGSLYDGWDFNIRPWAYEYLRKHPELLKPGDSKGEEIV